MAQTTASQNSQNDPPESTPTKPLKISESGLHRFFPKALGIERQVLQRLLKKLEGADVSVELWDGQQIGDAETSDIQLTIHTRQALWKLAVDTVDQLPELYTSGQIDIDGDLLKLLRVVNQHLIKSTGGYSGRGSGGQRLHHAKTSTRRFSQGRLPRSGTLQTEFFGQWLDEKLVLSAGLFSNPEATLEQAQESKFEAICQGLKLQPGEMLVDIGCGWGAFACYAAENYHVKVRGYSPVTQHVEEARERADAAGLSDQVEFIQGGWADVQEPCDAIVCIESIEEIGLSSFDSLGERFRRCLAPDGRGFIQTIGRNAPQAPNAPWIEQHLLPYVEIPSLSQLMGICESPGFTVCSLKNLRPHAQRTVFEWRQRFEDRFEFLSDGMDEKLLRAWRLYLAALQAAFETGSLQLFQLTFAASSASSVDPSGGEESTHSAIKKIV